MKRVIIVGAGPSGMMAAISTKMHYTDSEVIVLEGNNVAMKKLRQTGGGRCNLTAFCSVNEVIENIPKNGKFLYSALNQFGPNEIIDFFNKNGCLLKKEDHNRMFPLSNNALDVVNTLLNVARKYGVIIYFNEKVLDVDTDKKIIFTSKKSYDFDKLVIATGGITYPNTGSDGSGYKLAEAFNHETTKLLPAEVPLISNDSFIINKTLQGLSFKDVKLTIYNHQEKKIKELIHDLIFTHFGLSGPLALRASFFIAELLEKESKDIKVVIDFLPYMTISDLKGKTKEELNQIYKDNFIPKRLINFLELEKNDSIIDSLKSFKIMINQTRGFKYAFLTNGGINLRDVNPKNMQSKLNKDLYFCGEILDLNGYTGGFNITLALSTGYMCGKNIFKY